MVGNKRRIRLIIIIVAAACIIAWVGLRRETVADESAKIEVEVFSDKFVTEANPSGQAIIDLNTPEGIAHNYLFALEKGDYPRAYSYLSPGVKGYPEDSDEFIISIEDNSIQFDLDSITSLQFESVFSGEETAIINIKETTFSEGGIFGSSEYTRSFEMNLDLENGEWKITESDRYFAWCWGMEVGCH